MDRGIKKQEKRGAKKSHHKYEKKKEMGANSHIVEDSETHTVKESCANTTDRMVHSEDRTSDDAGSSFEPSEADQDDSTITSNYNTISSLAALKELLQGECGDSMETDSFFQHYFMKHCNTLPSRDSNSPFPLPERRRLSECREEDEEEERKESNPLPSTANSGSCSEATSQSNLNTALRDVSSSDGSADPLGRDSGLSRASLSAGTGSAEWEPAASITATSSHNSLTKEQPLNRTVMGEKHKFLVTRAPTQLEKVLRPQAQNAHTVHFGTKGAEELRPSVRSIFTGQNFHRDKKYFDSDLIEIRSSADSVITCDAEDIWVKRAELRPKVRRAEAARSDPYEEDGSEVGRPRAGTWGAQSREDDAIKEKNLKKEKDTPVKKDNDEKKRRKDEPKLDAAISKSTPQSMGQPCSSSQERRGTEDDQTHPMYQQTIHGTSGVSRRPALLDSFRGKKTDSKKHPSFMKQIRSAVQNMGHGSRPQSSIAGPRESPSTHSNSREGSAIKAPGQKGNSRDGSAHQLSASDKTYYHTVMAESRRPGPIAKVMDIFRSRQPDQDAASKRRARALAQQKQLAVGGANLRRKGQEADARRSSFGALLATRHRAADLSLDPHHAAMLFRDARGLPVADPFLEKVTLSDLEEDESQIFVKFFKFHKCYDLIPTSAKLVVFDTQLLVKKAFFALVYNGVRAAPLWDSAKQDFVGMLTITDFIKILQMYYTSPNIPMDQLEEHKLDTWRRVLAGSVKPLVSITPDSSLYDAIKMLISNRIHRLPLIDLETGNVLYILTHKRILRFLFLYINELPKPSYLHCKVRDLNMGTLNNIETATEETSIFEALKKFVNRRVSALPLIDSEGRLKDIYAKFDVINLAAEKTYHNLDVTLKKANEHRNEWFEGVQKCTLDETLFEVMERIVRAEVHRLVVVDEEEKVIGIISLSDLLNYLVLRPTGECNSDLRNELRKKILAERSASIGECSVELHHHEDTKEEIDDPNTSEEKDGSEKELDLLEDESKECENV